MPRPVIAFLTDFGTRDHYTGTMKGVVLGICPEATLVDITHDIPAHDVFAGALELGAAYRFFPPQTIFVGVVDPGVGSSRRAIAADDGEYCFVGPDNGLFTIPFRAAASLRVVELTEARYARPEVSRTFEGRDRFAPAAAWLAMGTEVSALGRPVADYTLLEIPAPAQDDKGVRGVVLRVDRFGNLVTNIDRQTFDRASAAGLMTVTIGKGAVARVVATYAEAGQGELCALFGSTGHLEIALNGENAAERLNAARGSEVRMVKSQNPNPKAQI